MAEPKIEASPEATLVPVVPASRLQRFTLNHPRTAQVVGLAAITAVVLGAVQAYKARRQIAEKADDAVSDGAAKVHDLTEKIN